MSKNHKTTKKDISTVNKAAYVRYMLIDECLRTPGDGMTKKEIQAKISKKLAEIRGEQNVREIDRQEEGEEYNDGGQEISIRQIEYDLNNMAEIFKFPFDLEECKTKDGRLVKYKYPDKNFSIRNMPISSTEAIHLQAVLEMLSRLKGLPQQKWINEAIENLSELHSVDVENVVEFDRSDYSDISDKLEIYFGPIYDAIVSKRVIKVKWCSFNEGNVEAVIHPYMLKQYNHRWYLIGKSEKNTIKIGGGFKGILNVPIDRMIQFSEETVIGYETKDVFEEYDVEGFYEDLIGVTLTKAGPQKIKFRVTDKLKPYILSKPLHETQTPIREDNTFSIKVHINYELRSLIRSHGVGLEVLEPQSLREEMRKEFEELVSKYK